VRKPSENRSGRRWRLSASVICSRIIHDDAMKLTGFWRSLQGSGVLRLAAARPLLYPVVGPGNPLLLRYRKVTTATLRPIDECTIKDL
jgi:hypothetical protein